MIKAYTLVNRVMKVRVKGNNKIFVIRPRELHANDLEEPYFECDVKSVLALGKGFAPTYKKIKVSDIEEYELLDTTEQADLRRHRIWHEQLNIDAMNEDQKEILSEVMKESFEKYEMLKSLNIQEYDF